MWRRPAAAGVSLAGTGTTLTLTGALTLGDQAAGELSVLGGAQMTIGGGVVGSSQTAPGNLDVEGAGSLLTINTGTLTVGANGPAEFTLGIGATLSGEVANGPFGVVSEYGNCRSGDRPERRHAERRVRQLADLRLLRRQFGNDQNHLGHGDVLHAVGYR